MAFRLLCGQPLSLSCAPSIDDLATVLRRHALAKPMRAFAFDGAGLKGAFHRFLAGFGKWGILGRRWGVSMTQIAALQTNVTTTRIEF